MGVIVITGPAGSGKTSLANALSASAPVMDLDAVGVHYADDWTIIDTLVHAAYLQGIRVFCGCGGNWMSIAKQLRQWDDDIRVICITSKFRKIALSERNVHSKRTRGYTRWQYDANADVVARSEAEQLAKELKGSCYDMRCVLQGHDDQRHEGSADEANLRQWRLGFPMPDDLRVGWRREGSKDSDPYIGEFLQFVKDNESKILHIAESTPISKQSASKWNQIPGFSEIIAKLKPSIAKVLEQRAKQRG